MGTTKAVIGLNMLSKFSVVEHRAMLLACCLAAVVGSAADEVAPVRDFTCFQTASGYSREIDVGSDVAIVYGVNSSYAERARSWRDAGYTISMMTGIAWGGYEDYYLLPDGQLKRDEIQTDKNGKLFMHGDSDTVGYNVPTPSYVEYIKKNITPAIEDGVAHIFLEEPEFWARTGWSQGFKDSWQAFYGEPWQAPDSSVDAQYRASRLKYELYFNALKEVCGYIDAQAAARGRTIETVVPTHSLISYAQWRIVSPESHLMDIAGLDGYVAQVWTGTARSANFYDGVEKSRTFETAYLEFGQMLSMVKPTGRKVWFLADPVEDNPNRSWADYKINYEATVIASLMWPEVYRFEVMPWPDRIFQGSYVETDMESQAERRVGIPRDYATEILTLINALNDMKQSEVEYDTGTRGIGIVVSDSLMFQRGDPTPSDSHLSAFYGLALPLLKCGVPVEIAQLENSVQPGAYDHLHTLVLTYEGQKPLKPEYHDALVRWVKAGGKLVYVGNGADPYHHVRSWWNQEGATDARPEQDLFARLGVVWAKGVGAPQEVGQGLVLAVDRDPTELARTAGGAAVVRDALEKILAATVTKLTLQHYVKIVRGPYVVASVFDESLSEDPVVLKGTYIDLLDPQLGVSNERALKPDERTLLYDLRWLDRHSVPAKVVAAAARIRDERWDGAALRFSARGPNGTRGVARVRLPAEPSRIVTAPEIPLEHAWDSPTGTLWLSFENLAQTIKFTIEGAR